MISEPRIDIFGLLADQKLRDYIESFERKYLDYRHPEVEDGKKNSDRTVQERLYETAERPAYEAAGTTIPGR